MYIISLVYFYMFLSRQFKNDCSINLFSFCFSRRTLVAIGTHDLDKLEGPFTYEVDFFQTLEPRI